MQSAAQVRKRELRASLRGQDRKTPDAAECAALDQGLLGIPTLDRARTVALYASIQHEPSLDPLAAELRDRGVAVAFPRIEGSDLVFCAIADPRELVAGSRGIREPVAAAPRIELARIDAFIVPGVLFDRRGFRLGRGGGHYDRLLNRARSDSLRIGATPADRVIPELPGEAWDVPMHWVVTPVERIRGDAA